MYIRNTVALRARSLALPLFAVAHGTRKSGVRASQRECLDIAVQREERVLGFESEGVEVCNSVV